MNISWLFGNGLDLSFGLKTSYHDFYLYLQKLSDEDINLKENLIFHCLEKDIKKQNDALWANYELRLGQIITQISKDEIQKFADDKVYIDFLLKKYLEIEESKLNINSNQTKERLSIAFQDLLKCKREVDNDLIRTLFKKYINTYFIFKPISFNYTKTVSSIWGDNNEIIKNLKIENYPNYSNFCKLETPFYLHGTLLDDEMVIGVNDETQIINESLKNNLELNKVLIKSELLKEAGQLHFEKYQKLIESSLLICIYGLSIGSTDSEYWKIIKNRLLNSDAVLIIYYYDENCDASHITKAGHLRGKVKNKFYDNSNATTDEISILDNKIIIEINHQLFTKIKN